MCRCCEARTASFVTVTKQQPGPTAPGEKTPTRCRWCRRPVEQPLTGRRREFCRASCRQRSYEARRRAGDLGLADDELVVTRNELDDARDRLAEVLDLIEQARGDLDDGVADQRVLGRLLDALSATLDENA